MFPSVINFKRYGSAILVLLAIFLNVYAGINSGDPTELPKPLSDSIIVNRPYISPTPGEIPVIASSPWVDGHPTSVEALSEVRDCGFNAILSYTTLYFFNKSWRMIEEAGLKAIIGFPEFDTPAGAGIIDTLKNNPVIGAWRIADEPREINFGKLSEACREIEKVDTTHICYINLVGSEAKEYFLGSSADYQDFLNRFQSFFHPAVWSYDYYPITKIKGKVKVNYHDFYESLEMFSKMSVLTQRPFWAYCQSMAFSYKGVEKPVANLATLSFEAFSALGYGAKGIVYWTYCQRPSNDTEFLSALKNLDGEKTPAWYDARQVNGEIKALNDVLLNANYIETRHTGSDLPSLCKSFHPGVECIASLAGTEAGLQLSFLENGDWRYAMIINKDIENSQKISLRFIKGYETYQMEPTYGPSGYYLKERKLRGSLKKVVAPGRYIIIRYKKAI